MSMISDKARKVIYDCCERWSRKLKKNVEDIQLNLHLKLGQVEHEGNLYKMPVVAYTVLNDGEDIVEDGKNVGELTFRDVLGAPDISKIKNNVEAFVSISIIEIAKEFGLADIDLDTNIDSRLLNVICVCRDKKDMDVYVYRGVDLLKQIEFEELFSEETLMKAMAGASGQDA